MATMTTQERRTALVAKLATIRHWLLGALAVPPVPGTVFNPRDFFLDPGRLPQVLAYWRFRAARAGCGAGLPRALRDAALDQASQACLTHFLDADYRRLGMTADEFARAVLYAFRRCRLAFWSDADSAKEIDRERRADRHGGDWRLWNRGQASRTPDPRRIVHAADAMGMDPNAVDGRGVTDEVPGPLVVIPGGPSGRGEGDGKMRLVTVRDVAVNVTGPDGERRELSQIDTRWRMVRSRPKAKRLPPCTVRDGVPMPRGRFAPSPVPAAVAGLHRDGVTTFRPTRAVPPVTVADAVHGMRRLGRSMPRGCDARRRIAANLRQARG